MDLSVPAISDALQNFEGLLAKYNSQASQAPTLQAGDSLPSVKDLVQMIQSPGAGGLSGGKKKSYGGSKKSSRSRRADLRERYRLSPRKRMKKRARKTKTKSRK
jgi:hypothetical protein